jgi:hypothetical protein
MIFLVVAGCHHAATSAKKAMDGAGQIAARIVVAGASADLEAAEHAPALATIYKEDLWVRVILPEMSMSQNVAITVETPSHESWRHITRTFTPEHHEIPGGYALDAEIALGDDEPMSPPPGTWTVRAEVAGRAEPLVTTFVLTR